MAGPTTTSGITTNGQPIADPDSGSGTVLPVHHWSPAIAPSGLTFYTGNRFPDGYLYFLTDSSEGVMGRLEPWG